MNLRLPAERIVIKCPNWVGDLVAATGTLRCIRRNYPCAKIALLLKPSLAPLMEGSPDCDETILYERHESSAAGRKSALATLREGRFDLAVLLAHGFGARFLLWRAGVPRRVGVSRGRWAPLLTDRAAVSEVKAGRQYASKVDLYRAVCELLGCEGAEDQSPRLHVSEEAAACADALLAECGRGAGRRLVGLVPGARYGPSKRWPAERFASLADRLIRELRCDVLLVTAPSEKDVAEEVIARMGERPLRPPEGRADLAVLKGLIRRCDLLVCNDTGPRHIAIAFGVPTVTLMGPTDPAVTESPYEKGRVIRQAVPCAPCYKRECPSDHACMTAITVERVFGEACEWLA